MIDTVEVIDGVATGTTGVTITLVEGVSVSTVELIDGITHDSTGVSITVVEGGLGPQGPPGVDAELTETHDVIAVGEWTYIHTFAYPPDVRLVDISGEAVSCGAQYPDIQTVHLNFPTPFTGTIILS
jgi:hypothetical protein